MRNFVIYILIVVSHLSIGCSDAEQRNLIEDNLFEKVSYKLENDYKSFVVFNALLNAYILDQQIKDKSSSYYFDMYASLYNKGMPLTRLIKDDSLIKVFDEMCEIPNLHSNTNIQIYYKRLIRNFENYTTENEVGEIDSGKWLFSKFLDQYYILPSTK